MSTPHNRAEIGEIAKSVLITVDPDSARHIAETYLEDAVLFNDVRGMLGFTGKYNGKRMSVMGAGVGVPSLSIYVSELMMFYGVKNIVRIANCRSLRNEIKPLDLIFSMGCCSDNGYLRHTFGGDYTPVADFDMLCAGADFAEAMGAPYHVGLTKTSDMYYSEPVPLAENWARYGVLGIDLTNAALYTLAAKFNCRALAITIDSSGAFYGKDLEDEGRRVAVDRLIRIALDSAAQFSDEG